MEDKYFGKYVVITGGSMGLGRAIAEKLAKRVINLVLLSLPDEDLGSLCEGLSNKYGVKILFFETDLRDSKNISEFATWVFSQELDIIGLVNNAGLGGSSTFEMTPISFIDTMILVNIRALTLLTRLFIPELKRKEKAFILNISSIAAFKPMPFKTVYPASKAFVYSFSVGLGEELKDTGIQISVLHPGPMDTSEENSTRLNKHGFLGRLVLLTVDDIAEIAVDRMFAGKKVIIPGIFNKICINLLKIIPRQIALPIISKVLKKEIVKQKKVVRDVERQNV